MRLTSGTRIGSYEIVELLGSGGMGEVFRARDTKLGRDVAIKILPDVFLGDPDRVARFEREARTLASLSHANIAQIYGVEVDESAAGDARPRALVMELVEGQDLSEIVARGPMGMRDVLAIARQIAAALETAHEHGIIHRDLKPANVKVREDGAVKVLDFGLAKALLPEASEQSADAMNSPTLTARATQLGIVLGTAAYMAPEQAKGLPVDRRADVWAFGVVLYEMLTGRRLFDGPDATEMMAQVLTREPDWRVLPLETPASVRRLLARCLVKDRRQRLDSMSAARLDLDEAAAPAAPAPAPARRPSARLTAAAFAGAGLIAGALITRLLWPAAAPTAASTDSDLVVTSVTAAPEVLSAFTHGFALSPDGSTLVYVARTADGKRQLWKRRLSDPRSELIAGTDDAIYPFWSPDSRHVGFFTNESIKRIAAAGGPAQTITAARGFWPRGSWSSRDEILFSVGAGIMRVAASGGRPEKIVPEGPARDPQWLPDGIHFLYVLRSRPARLFVASVDGTKPGDELYDFTTSDDDPGMSLSQAGFIAFNHAGVLSIQRFDVTARKLIGPVVAAGEKAGTPRSWLAVTTAGNTIVALNPSAGTIGGTPGDPGDPVSRLQWIDRQGRVVGEVGTPGRFWTLRLSHDGLRAAVNPNDDIWTIDTRTGLRTRIAVAASTIWSHDDRQLIFRNAEGIVGKSVTGEGQTRLLAKGRSIAPTDASLNGQLVALTGRSEADASSSDVLLLTLADGSIKPFLSTPDNESQASFSPDSRWLAYSSDSTGRYEVYVRSLSGDGAPLRISAEGGEHPMWRRDGRELFFLSPTDQIVAVDVAAIATGRVGVRTTLFRMVMNDIVRTAYPPFAVTPDGQRFLVNVPSAPEPLTLIRNVGRLLNGQ